MDRERNGGTFKQGLRQKDRNRESNGEKETKGEEQGQGDTDRTEGQG